MNSYCLSMVLSDLASLYTIMCLISGILFCILYIIDLLLEFIFERTSTFFRILLIVIATNLFTLNEVKEIYIEIRGRENWKRLVKLQTQRLPA